MVSAFELGRFIKFTLITGSGVIDGFRILRRRAKAPLWPNVKAARKKVTKTALFFLCEQRLAPDSNEEVGRKKLILKSLVGTLALG